VKDTEIAFLATSKRAALDRINAYTDGVQYALLHIPQPNPSRTNAEPHLYAKYIINNSATNAQVTA
jgi:hypothetical protein